MEKEDDQGVPHKIPLITQSSLEEAAALHGFVSVSPDATQATNRILRHLLRRVVYASLNDRDSSSTKEVTPNEYLTMEHLGTATLTVRILFDDEKK